MKIPRPLVQHGIVGLLLSVFGYIGCGFVGIVLGFWVLMSWYAVWRKPWRWELLCLAGIGLVGGLVLMPHECWPSGFIGVFFSILFVLTGISPLVFRNRQPAKF